MGGRTVAVCMLVVLAAGTAAAQPAPPVKARVLLIGAPEVEAASLGGVDIVRAALERGAVAGAKSGTAYARVISLRDIENENSRYIDPILKFAKASQDQILDHIAKRYQITAADRRHTELAASLLSRFYRSSSGELVAELELWALPSWDLKAKKTIGGCGASLEDVAEGAREAAFVLASGTAQNAPIDIRAQVLPLQAVDDNQFTAKTGEPLTLDSCATIDPDQDAFSVKWRQLGCATDDPARCVLPHASIRRRQAITLSEPGRYRFELEVATEVGTGSCVGARKCTKLVTIEAVEPPKARPRVRTEQPAPIAKKPRRFEKAPMYMQEQQAIAPSQFDDSALEQAARNAIVAPTVRTIRIAPGKTIPVFLDAGESSPAPAAPDPHAPDDPIAPMAKASYEWKQLEGPEAELKKEDPSGAVSKIEVDWKKSGHYTFALTVKNGTFEDVQQVSFLVVPESKADAGPDHFAYVGERVALDIHGSYDVLDDAPLFTWAVEGSSKARIVNPNSRAPTFVAEAPGTYTVRVFVRAKRTFGDQKLVDVATDTTTVHVVGGRHRVGVFGVGIAEIESPLDRDFIGGGFEYAYRHDPGVFRVRTHLGGRRDVDHLANTESWDSKWDLVSAEIGIAPARLPVTGFVGVGLTPPGDLDEDDLQFGFTMGVQFAPRIRATGLSLLLDATSGILFLGRHRPYVGLTIGVGYAL